ncbi:hypothetical protein HN011_005085, partial [Eciton burchellii]
MQASDECTSGPKQQSVSSSSSSDKPPRSVPDGWPFRKAKNLDDQTQKPIRLGIDPDAEEYDMNHKRRGVALILNHVNFESMATRKGSVMDSLNLKASLGKLGFDVRIYTDPTIKTITATLQA